MARGVEGGGERRGDRRVGGWPDGGGGRGSREKDIKVRNSQRGERAPPRHRLDRGSLIPLLECSPPSSVRHLQPPTHPPSSPLPPLSPGPLVSTQGSPRPPTSTYSVELESPRVRALHTHSRAYVSSCPAAGAATAATVARRRERRRRRARSDGSREKKRQRLRLRRVAEATLSPPIPWHLHTRHVGDTNV